MQMRLYILPSSVSTRCEMISSIKSFLVGAAALAFATSVSPERAHTQDVNQSTTYCQNVQPLTLQKLRVTVSVPIPKDQIDNKDPYAPTHQEVEIPFEYMRGTVL